MTALAEVIKFNDLLLLQVPRKWKYHHRYVIHLSTGYRDDKHNSDTSMCRIYNYRH